jgi:hypothetical protein
VYSRDLAEGRENLAQISFRGLEVHIPDKKALHLGVPLPDF